MRFGCNGGRGGASITKAAGVLAALTGSLMLGACAQIPGLDLGTEPPAAQTADAAGAAAKDPRPSSELEKATEYWAKEVNRNPKDGAATLNYAKNLKALGRKRDALSVLQSSYLYNANNREYLSEYGRLALELDQVSTAVGLLERADDPAKPDWRIISARGTALAKMSQYKDAIPYFERARELAPGQASVLNNLAMAYTMDGQADKAEELLRRAAELKGNDPRVRQNLALVLGLQGKHNEAKDVASKDLDAEQAQSNVDYVRRMVKTEVDPPVVAAAEPMPPRVAPVVPVESAPLDPETIIKAALKAEAAKTRAAGNAAPAAAARRKVASGDTEASHPALKPSSP